MYSSLIVVCNFRYFCLSRSGCRDCDHERPRCKVLLLLLLFRGFPWQSVLPPRMNHNACIVMWRMVVAKFDYSIHTTIFGSLSPHLKCWWSERYLQGHILCPLSCSWMSVCPDRHCLSVSLGRCSYYHCSFFANSVTEATLYSFISSSLTFGWRNWIAWMIELMSLPLTNCLKFVVFIFYYYSWEWKVGSANCRADALSVDTSVCLERTPHLDDSPPPIIFYFVHSSTIP